MVRDVDARAILDGERIDYWLSVGAQPSEKVGVLIKKYGKDGTHLEQQRAAVERLKAAKPRVPLAAVPSPTGADEQEPAAGEEAAAPEEAAVAEEPAAEEPAAETSEESSE